MRAALLAHDQFGMLTSKTATCILRYPRTYATVAVVDRSKAGREASEFVGAPGAGIPVVASVRDALAHDPEVLILGIAPRGGALPESWRDEIRFALEHGLDVHSGLHTFLSEDAEFRRLADARGARLWDVRRPTRPPRIATGEGRAAAPLVVHTVGSDCNAGKMTTTVELVEEAKRRGHRAAFAATGQTGIMIGCDAGAPVDRIVSDFVAGAAEELVLECAQAGFDLVAVEGQGSLTHPAYSGVTVGLLHGSFPDQVIFCHVAGRTHHAGYETGPHAFPLPPLRDQIRLVEDLLAPTTGGRVVAVSVATFHLGEAAARQELARLEADTGLPATDPVRFGAGKLLDAVLAATQHSTKPGAQRLCALKPVPSG